MSDVPANIKELGDKLVALTLLDAQQLSNYLKDEYNIEPASGGGIMMTAPAAASDGGDDAGADAEPTSFNVMLVSAGDKKIQVIKAVRELTGLGLKEAKTLVDALPAAVKEKVDTDEANSMKKQLEEVGASIELKPA